MDSSNNKLLSSIEAMQKHMNEEEKEASLSTPCFVALWKDENGSVCPEKECDIRSYCRAGWQLYQLDSASVVKKEKQVLEVPLEPVKKRKHKVHKRRGYSPLGRKVDSLLVSFLSVFGKLPKLPVSWDGKDYEQKFSHLGKITMSATASYHSILYEGVVIARFWTNSPTTALVDIVEELVGPVVVALNAFDGAYSKPQKTPEKNWKKHRPCTHRVRVRDERGARLLANVIKKKFR